MSNPVERLDLASLSGLTFFEPDTVKFPALPMAYDALKRGGSAPTAYNSGNEVAVERFIRGELRFTDIASCVAYVMERMEDIPVTNMEELLYCDSAARRLAREFKL